MQRQKLKVKKMADVISFRFREHELNHINKLSEEEKTDKTSAARELIEYGWTYYILTQYKKGKISLESAARELQMALTDLIDLLADFGIQSPITYEDYLEGLENIE
jgi:predicted HTH domain antitoxin